MGRIARWGTRLTLAAAVSVGVMAQTTGIASAFSGSEYAYTYDNAFSDYTALPYEEYTDWYWGTDSGFEYTDRAFHEYIDFSWYYGGGGDDYPYSPSICGHTGQCDGIDDWGFSKQQCVSFVAWRLSQRGVVVDGASYGDAGNWDRVAQARGYAVDSTPTVGSVAHWRHSESITWSTANGGTRSIWAGPQGHVAYVTAVHADGTVDIEEYNQNGDRSYHEQQSIKAPRYIHF
jgi:surface antigen